MKKYFYLPIICSLVVAFSLVSCSREKPASPVTIDLSGKVLTKEQFAALSEKMVKIHDKMMLKGIDTIQTEAEAQAALEPLVESGEAIYQEILANSASIPPADLVEIEALTDQQLAEIGATFYAVANSTLTTEQKKVLTCISSAFTIAGVIDAAISGTTAIMTLEATVAIVKALAKRFCFGYLGTIWAIYSFLDCVGAFES
jgi:hypothetical protein